MGAAARGSIHHRLLSPTRTVQVWVRRRRSSHMSDHRMALLPFSTLATYAPDGDHDTELMAELQREGQNVSIPEGSPETAERQQLKPGSTEINLRAQSQSAELQKHRPTCDGSVMIDFY